MMHSLGRRVRVGGLKVGMDVDSRVTRIEGSGGGDGDLCKVRPAAIAGESAPYRPGWACVGRVWPRRRDAAAKSMLHVVLTDTSSPLHCDLHSLASTTWRY